MERKAIKGKDLIKLIQEKGLEEFEVGFSFTDGYNVFPNIRTFEITGIEDIGYSEKVFSLEGEET